MSHPTKAGEKFFSLGETLTVKSFLVKTGNKCPTLKEAEYFAASCGGDIFIINKEHDRITPIELTKLISK